MTFLFHNSKVEFEGQQYNVKKLELLDTFSFSNLLSREDDPDLYEYSYRKLKLFLATSKNPQITFIYIDKTQEFLVNVNISYGKPPFEINLGILDKKYFKDIEI